MPAIGDCADAMAGVVYGLTMRREIWIHHGVDPVQFFQMTEGKESNVRGEKPSGDIMDNPEFTKHFNVVK